MGMTHPERDANDDSLHNGTSWIDYPITDNQREENMPSPSGGAPDTIHIAWRK
jgi:hypothetical protein